MRIVETRTLALTSMSVGVVRVVEDHFVADTDELSAESSSQVFFGEHRCGRPDGYRGCVKQKDLLASPSVVKVVGGHHNRSPGGEFLVDDIEDDGA